MRSKNIYDIHAWVLKSIDSCVTADQLLVAARLIPQFDLLLRKTLSKESDYMHDFIVQNDERRVAIGKAFWAKKRILNP